MTSYWPGQNFTTWPTCPSCGTSYIGWHDCPATTRTWSDPVWRLPDADVERIAQRVVQLMRQKRNAEQ